MGFASFLKPARPVVLIATASMQNVISAELNIWAMKRSAEAKADNAIGASLITVGRYAATC